MDSYQVPSQSPLSCCSPLRFTLRHAGKKSTDRVSVTEGMCDRRQRAKLAQGDGYQPLQPSTRPLLSFLFFKCKTTAPPKRQRLHPQVVHTNASVFFLFASHSRRAAHIHNHPSPTRALHGCMMAILLHGGDFADVRKSCAVGFQGTCFVRFCKEDSAPRGFPQSVLVRIQVGLVLDYCRGCL